MAECNVYNKGDYCLKASLWSVGQWWQFKNSKTEFAKEKIEKAKEVMQTMIEECRLDRWWGHRKSKEYRWSNSGSEKEIENTLRKSPTWWIYHNRWSLLGMFLFLFFTSFTGVYFLRNNCIFGVFIGALIILAFHTLFIMGDPHKGLNGDQYRAYFLWLYLTNDWLGALKVMFGYIYRLGLAPSLCEWAIIRPQAYVLLLKVKFPFRIEFLWRPMYWVVLLVFRLTSKREINRVPIESDTTNKISLFPTYKVLKWTLSPIKYITATYSEYFKKGTDGFCVGESIRLGVLREN